MEVITNLHSTQKENVHVMLMHNSFRWQMATESAIKLAFIFLIIELVMHNSYLDK